MNIYENIWLACAIDGEGCISLQISHYTPEVAVMNTNYEFVEKAGTLMGVETLPIKRKKEILTESRDSRAWKICYGARLRKIKYVRLLLEELLPFLIIKRYHAELMIEFCKLREKAWKYNMQFHSPREHEIFWELKELNGRGRY